MIWFILIILTILMQEIFVSKNKPKIYIHIALFLYLIFHNYYEFALLIMIGGLVFESSLADINENKDNKKRTAQRYKLELFICTLLTTFILSVLFYNSSSLKIDLSQELNYKKFEVILTALILAFYVKTKAKKWK